MGDVLDEAAGSRSYDSIAEMQEKEEQLDEFVNITVGKKKNIAIADDETEGDIVESGENLSPQVGKESKRAKLFGLARNRVQNLRSGNYWLLKIIPFELKSFGLITTSLRQNIFLTAPLKQYFSVTLNPCGKVTN